MNKLYSIILLVSVAISLNAQINKVAVVTIRGTEELRMNLGDYGDLSYALDYTKSNFQSYNALQDYHKYIFSDLVNEFPFEFINEEDVINNEVYKELKKKDDERLITALKVAEIGIDGYNLNIVSQKNFKKYKEAIPEADAFLITTLKVEITPDKMIKNTGTAVIMASMEFQLFSADGEQVIDRYVVGYSKGKFKVVANQIVDGKEKVPGYLDEAIQDMYNNVKGSFPSILKNYNKRVKKVYS